MHFNRKKARKSYSRENANLLKQNNAIIPELHAGEVAT